MVSGLLIFSYGRCSHGLYSWVYISMVCIVIAYMDIWPAEAHGLAFSYIGMAYSNMADTVMLCIVLAYISMVCIDMACRGPALSINSYGL